MKFILSLLAFLLWHSSPAQGAQFSQVDSKLAPEIFVWLAGLPLGLPPLCVIWGRWETLQAPAMSFCGSGFSREHYIRIKCSRLKPLPKVNQSCLATTTSAGRSRRSFST